MQAAVQRRVGRLMSKAPADDAKVAALIRDYENIEQSITNIVTDAQELKGAWSSLAATQQGIAVSFQDLYQDGSEARPEALMQRTANLEQTYSSLKDELGVESAALETFLLRPAMETKELLQPLRKTIKHREKKRQEYEKSQDKVSRLQQKGTSTVKDEAHLVKAQDELGMLAEEYDFVDAHLRETLPPLVQAARSILPHLLSAAVLVQTRLIGLWYTVLSGYCQSNGFPSSAPRRMNDVVAQWEHDAQPVMDEMEQLGCLHKSEAGGAKSYWRSRLPGGGGQTPPSSTPPSSSSWQMPSIKRPGGSRIPSSSAASATGPSPHSESSDYGRPSPAPYSGSPSPHSGFAPTDSKTARPLIGGQRPGSSITSQRSDYFGGAAAVAAAKKKPPPPPPPKPPRQPPRPEFVVAQYDFVGQGDGDLSFSTGDRIRVVKKTGTDQDWWQGELNNAQGSFPANYCQPAV